MTLKGLKDAGILTQKQFEGQVQETLTLGDAPTVAPPIKKRAHASLLRTASSHPKQRSLFNAGFWIEKTTKQGDVVRIDGDMRAMTSPPVTHKCKFCDWRHEFKRHVALHEKTHSEWARPVNQPVVHDQSLTSLMSSSTSTDTNSSLLSWSPVRLTLAPGAKISKGRRGADVRIFRSWRFKLKVLLFKDDKDKRCSNVDDIAVARKFHISKSLLSKWHNKEREKIFTEANSIRKNETKVTSTLIDRLCCTDSACCQMRKRKPRFPLMEEALNKEMIEERKHGRRIGPQWIMRRARLLCIELETDLSVAYGFKARPAWLRKFCKRWRWSLRCKTNTKKTPVAERLPAIAAYLAKTRRRFQNEASNARNWHLDWGRWLREDRFNVDQVPAGFHAPTTTYANTNAKRVDIASNESADNHRECTLQVLIRCIPYRVGVPRGGQPKLSLIFRGKGGSFFDKERELYHKDVLVSFQKKVMFLYMHSI